MTINLFDFQREDVDKLQDQISALIANEMGTGKTYEAIVRDQFIREHGDPLWKAPKRTLVVAPLTVLSSWEDHYTELTDLPVVTIEPKNRKKSLEQFTDTNANGVYLVHWEALRVFPELKAIYWLHIIADECHRAKNRKAQQTLALKRLKSVHKTAMSGTPVVNRPDELWSILNWLWPKEYGAFWKFYNRYVDFEIKYPQGYHDIKGPKNEDELQERLQPFMVRRLKKDVLKDLPDKYYTAVWVELEAKQRRAYDAMAKNMLAWIGEHEDTPLVAPVVIAQLIRLQQFAIASMDLVDNSPVDLDDIATLVEEKISYQMIEPSSKLDAVMQILEDDPDDQFVIFSQFKQPLKLLAKRLEAKGISYGLITGDVDNEARSETVRRFQAGGLQVVAGTVAAGGVGITLTASSTVIFIDRSWSPAYNQQAEDRLHRIGQENAVQVIDILAKNTVDLGRMQRLELKWSWIRKLLGDT